MIQPMPDEDRVIATSEEVLATFTELLRSEKSAERLKAAELLAKHHGLFAAKEDAPISPDTISEVEAAVADILAQCRGDP